MCRCPETYKRRSPPRDMLTGGDVVVKVPKTINIDTARVATDTPSGMGPRLDILEVNLEPPKTFIPCHVFFSGPITSDADSGSRAAPVPRIYNLEVAERGVLQSSNIKL